MLKHKMLWVVLPIFILFLLTVPEWWDEGKPDQPQASANEQVSERPVSNIQPLVEEPVVSDEPEAESLPASEMPPFDESVVEFKYQNLKRLMSIHVDTLDKYQINMVVQQIINELPEMVNMGKIHPLDATFAHTKAVARKGHELQAEEVEVIKQNYIDLYPFSINNSQLDLH